MKIVIGCDQGALELKNYIKEVLAEFTDITVEDVGTYTADSVDYPDIAEKICAKITSGEAERGIALCGTGIGISIACNKVDGIRAALCHNVFTARMSRQHNDANVLAMGGRDIGFGPAAEMVRVWVAEEFLGGRHKRRVDKIMAIADK
ncbi:ribose 5-phosphate isomerase B [Pectinatus haikarae]|uniref:Ribose 5-phosphate isomerase B n=1 Tax=Pectinatus haikarae TaxID=349096 RepID=A0ABT9Y528_9FIRM|nr:ribose 5-phosphate isomerase B [Pectinatus haikarae]MDQ0202940.1 ribose 5-phosphate isomerase B [Pectinatus haikarae]